RDVAIERDRKLALLAIGAEERGVSGHRRAKRVDSRPDLERGLVALGQSLLELAGDRQIGKRPNVRDGDPSLPTIALDEKPGVGRGSASRQHDARGEPDARRPFDLAAKRTKMRAQRIERVAA